MLTLDERERRAEERLRQKTSPTRSPLRSGMGDSPGESMSSPHQVPRPGESLFDNYANLQDPTKFSTDEQEVEDLLRMGVGFQRDFRDERSLEAGWDPSPHKNPPAMIKNIKPITREPWTIDQQVYNRAFDTSDFGKPERYGTNPNPPLNIWRQEDKKRRPKQARQVGRFCMLHSARGFLASLPLPPLGLAPFKPELTLMSQHDPDPRRPTRMLLTGRGGTAHHSGIHPTHSEGSGRRRLPPSHGSRTTGASATKTRT
jgi:hypothetical protein